MAREHRSKARAGLPVKMTGRPQIEFKEEYCKMLENHAASGLSIRSFSGAIKVSWPTLLSWKTDYPNFGASWLIAKENLRLFYEQLLRDNATGDLDSRTFNAIRFALENYAKFSERKKVESKVDQTITHSFDASSLSNEELDKEIKKLESEEKD